MITIASQWVGEATVDEVTAQIPITVVWHDSDPLFLSCTFEGTKWEIGRDLIKAAYGNRSHPTGRGDVTATVENFSLNLTLNTPEGVAKIWMPSWRMWDVLHRTYTYTPEGSEELDVDGAIERILSS
jgi:hypothetical protein